MLFYKYSSPIHVYFLDGFTIPMLKDHFEEGHTVEKGLTYLTKVYGRIYEALNE